MGYTRRAGPMDTKRFPAVALLFLGAAAALFWLRDGPSEDRLRALGYLE